MPKHAVHAYVLNSVISRLCGSDDPKEREIGDIMRRNRPAALLGSFGPDLHVWSPDYAESSLLLRFLSNLRAVADRYGDVAKVICDSIESIEKEGGCETFPVSRSRSIEGLGVIFRDMVYSITHGLFSGIADGRGLFSDPAAIQSMIGAYLGDTTDRRGGGIAGYKWSDRLHFWNSGEYARDLLAASRNDMDRAYAYGFMTHIAADLIVHQMVRKAIGGSYNKNPQGHFVCESLMDAWSYYGRSGLSLNGHMVGDLVPEKEMPYSIARLIPGAMAMAYGREDGIESYPSEHEMKETYARIRQYYELQDCLKIAKPKMPFSDVKYVVCDIVANYADKCDWDTAESIMEDPCLDNAFFGYRDDYRGELNYRLSSIGEVVELACRQVDAMLGLLGLVGDEMDGYEAVALLYGIWRRAYLIVSETLLTVALMGFTIPEPECLDSVYANGLLLVNDVDSGIQGPEYYIETRPFNAERLKGYIDAHEKCDPIIAGDDDDLGNAVDMAVWMVSHSGDKGLEKYVFANWAMESEEL